MHAAIGLEVAYLPAAVGLEMTCFPATVAAAVGVADADLLTVQYGAVIVDLTHAAAVQPDPADQAVEQ